MLDPCENGETSKEIFRQKGSDPGSVNPAQVNPDQSEDFEEEDIHLYLSDSEDEQVERKTGNDLTKQKLAWKFVVKILCPNKSCSFKVQSNSVIINMVVTKSWL